MGDDGSILVEDKAYITQKDAKEIQKKSSTPEITVRGYLTNEYEYFDAFRERFLVIAEANTETDEHDNFTTTRIGVRKNSEPIIAYVGEITHIDVSPKQIMSETTALIPFLEHDHATRAEMGTNMMRQAVPLLQADAPVVGTGMERIIGEGSGYVIKAEESGEIIGVDAKHISILYASGKKALYELKTFERSNHDMIIHQKPRVSTGDTVTAGQVLADGQSIENGELALGKNLRVAFMSWEGYNYEDAIIISSRLVEQDVYTSVHINEYILDVRETKLGPEETTYDIPNVSAAKLKDLDEEGIVRIGAYVEG